ncbi:MAG: carboxypeptidase-like regulatory domain-containing protein, partial [Bryobacteraceae bacterium]
MFSRYSLTQLACLASTERRLARCVFHLTFAVSCLLTLCVASYGQSTFGTVLGTVKDPSGSAVPKAAVELINTGTNAARTIMTNDTGGYEFVNVEQGTYQVKVTAAGF